MLSKNVSVNERFNHWITLFLKIKLTDVPLLFKLGNDSNPSVPDEQVVLYNSIFINASFLEKYNVTAALSFSLIGHTVKELVIFHHPLGLVNSLIIQIQALSNPVWQFWIILKW